MELLRYAPHLNSKKLKVKKFVFGLNFNIRLKVRILMQDTLHDTVHKGLIVEEDLTSGGKGRTPARPTRQKMTSVQKHQTPTRHTSGYREMSRGSTFMTP
jgi:hypothetical protein